MWRGHEQTLEYIRKAVEQAAGCKALHVDTEAVIEVFRGQVMWDGVVEIFDLQRHPKAKRAYGWETGEGEDAKYTAVLEIRPVTSSNTAVRAAIAAEARATIEDLESVPASELQDFLGTLLDQDNQPLATGLASLNKSERDGLISPHGKGPSDTIPTTAKALRIEHRSLVVGIRDVYQCPATFQGIHFHFQI